MIRREERLDFYTKGQAIRKMKPRLDPFMEIPFIKRSSESPGQIGCPPNWVNLEREIQVGDHVIVRRADMENDKLAEVRLEVLEVRSGDSLLVCVLTSNHSLHEGKLPILKGTTFEIKEASIMRWAA